MNNNNNTARDILHETALKAPSSSGVYLWRNSSGSVIYVGKAKNLKNRLSSYFSGTKDIKTRLLIAHAISIEYITTANEYEAFLLENNLIKKHSPRYNINLKDDKSYPVLRITHENFPRLFKTRRILHDGSLYFGPFPNVTALDTFIDTLYRLYPIRHCKNLKKRDYPCLYYHIGKCKAPCCGKISSNTYNKYFGEIIQLLKGKGKETKKQITLLMKQAAKNLDFEKAARLRDGLRALTILQNQNIVEGFDSEDRDYIASFREGEIVSFTVIKIRGGKLLGRDNYRTVSLNEDEELIPEFMNAYYTKRELIPPSIYVPSNNGLDNMQQWFKDKFGENTRIILVTKNIKNTTRHQAAMNMAVQNAHEDIIRRLRERGDIPALQELQKLLRLDHIPIRIEGFDIAHIGGKFPVASLISFYNGNPDKKNYRYFRLRTTNGIIDDFASMREATSRRYTRLLNEQADLPDLILIDGGIGQVNAVESILKSLNLNIPIAGLAKRNEEIYLPHVRTPIKLPKRSDALRLLQRIRDETHRFATTRNQRLRTKENTISIFTKLPGIGIKRAQKIIKIYKTLENFSKTTPDLLAKELSVSNKSASTILLAATKKLQERNQKKTIHSKNNKYNTKLAAQALEAADNTPEYS